MKFFVVAVLVALVALSSAEEPAVRKLEQVKEVEPANEKVDAAEAARNKRGFVLGAYTAPVAAAAVEVAAPYTAAYTQAYTAPVAYTYSGLPYAYSAYAPYYSYPAVYV